MVLRLAIPRRAVGDPHSDRRPKRASAGASGFAAAAVLALAVFGIGPHFGTYRVVTILSGSMAPAAPAGAVAFSTPIPTSAVEVGDVITYAIPVADHRVVTHRVIEVLEEGDAPVIRTKGDRAAEPDPWVARLDPGTVWRMRFALPYAGYAVSFLRRPEVQLLLVRAVPLVVALLWLREIWGWRGWGPRSSGRRRVRWRMPAVSRGAVLRVAVVVAAAGQFIAGRPALGGFSASRTATPSVTSGTLQPASNLNATGGCGLLILGPKADLSWTVTPSTWATGYRIDRWRNGSLEATYIIPDRTQTSYEVTGLAGNTTYTFRLYAYRHAWTSSSVEDPATTPLLCL